MSPSTFSVLWTRSLSPLLVGAATFISLRSQWPRTHLHQEAAEPDFALNQIEFVFQHSASIFHERKAIRIVAILTICGTLLSM